MDTTITTDRTPLPTLTLRRAGRHWRITDAHGCLIALVESEGPEDDQIARIMAAGPALYDEYSALLRRVETMASAMRARGLGQWVNEWLCDGILDGKAIWKAERNGEEK